MNDDAPKSAITLLHSDLHLNLALRKLASFSFLVFMHAFMPHKVRRIFVGLSDKNGSFLSLTSTKLNI